MMGFFDRDDEDEETEEVTLSVPEDSSEESRGQLKDEAEARLTGGDSSDGSDTSSGDSSGMLPGMGSGSSGSESSTGSGTGRSSESTSGSEDRDVSLEDIHRQNKQIKSILKDIRSEIKDEGDMNGVL